jgi:hypothetical protein
LHVCHQIFEERQKNAALWDRAPTLGGPTALTEPESHRARPRVVDPAKVSASVLRGVLQPVCRNQPEWGERRDFTNYSRREGKFFTPGSNVI